MWGKFTPKQNLNIPPLKYNYVYNLKKDFPDQEIIINGGITSIEETINHLKKVGFWRDPLYYIETGSYEEARELAQILDGYNTVHLSGGVPSYEEPTFKDRTVFLRDWNFIKTGLFSWGGPLGPTRRS